MSHIIAMQLIKITSFSLILLARFVALCISISLPTGGMIRQLPGSLFLGLMIPTIIHWKTMSVTMSMKIREQRKITWKVGLSGAVTIVIFGSGLKSLVPIIADNTCRTKQICQFHRSFFITGLSYKVYNIKDKVNFII